ncbi:glutaredoxin domain-containing protein [Microbacterium invictum]|uniref:Glutaredoxin domain-containing protein n=1 Tax=Microbacterium invictum TaxID=515415 RepID=A0ABZ0VBK2_9MICO|nr:glutaredoxin domain-containing protein [Microbacterium invictum]WQB70988.1 glutaredoxin domain-containing protein [Microbacterium invictum]
MIRVVVYSSGDACMQCRMTERLMEAAGLVFERIDLSDPANARHLAHVLRDLGYSSAPVVEVAGGTHWAGFRPDCIGELVSRLDVARER